MIVQVGSALAYRSIPLQSAYCGAKHAVRGFTDSLRSELIHDKSAVRLTMVRLPAIDTPQFGWVKSRLPREARPIPPIYQPELAAEAIFWAARHRRREVALGFPTLKAIWGRRFIPGRLDCCLARLGYEGQQAAVARDPSRPFNLWAPVPGDHGARGESTPRARRKSAQFWLTTHRGTVAIATGLAAAASLLARGIGSR